MKKHILRNFTPYHPLPYLCSSPFLFFAFDGPGAQAHPTLVILPWYNNRAPRSDEVVGEEVIR